MTNFAELRESQKEETHDIEKYIFTATSEGNPVTHLTTAGEIKKQRGSKDEYEMVIKEYTIDIQEATVGSIDQSQLQSVVDVEIVKMSTGTEEEKNENIGKNKEVEEDEAEAEMEEIKQMPDEQKEENTASETEVAEQSETHAKSIEKEQAHWDVEITENKERAEDEVMAESGKDLIEENRDDNKGQEKSEPKDKDTVLQQSVEVKDQIEMEADSVREVLTTEEVLCDQPKQNEAETEVSEPNQTMTSKDTLIEKASKNKLGPDEAEQVFNKCKLPQKRTLGLTPSRTSKRLRHQPAEKDLKTTKSVKTGQQRSKHHSKVMMQNEDIEQSTDEPEHDVSEVMEYIQEAQFENENKAESEVEEYKEKDMLTVKTVSTMDVEITQVEETVFPEVSELVEREETDQEEALLQSTVEPPEIQGSKTTPEEDEKTVQNSTEMLTLSEAKVVLVDLHELSHKEAGDNHGGIGIPEKEEIKITMSSEQQTTEENTKPMEEPACTTTTEGYDVATDANRTLEQSTAYKDQEYEPESETTEVFLLSQVDKPEKNDFEQDKEDKQDLYEADKFPRQGNQTQKKGSIDIPRRSTRLKDQPVDPGVTVRYLRSTLNPVKITPVRRSTRSKVVIQQVESVEPQVDAKLRTDENPEREKLVAEDVSPEENEKENTNTDETASVECGSSELLRAAEIADKEKEHQITKVTGEIPLIETEADEDVENRVEQFKKMENKEENLAGQMDSDIEMSSLAQEVHVQEEEVPNSTERHLRRKTIIVQTPPIRKSRCAQKQLAKAAVEHQERHTVVSKNKTDTILMTKEKEDKMDRDVNKMENKEEHFTELEPVEVSNMSRNEYEKASAITEEAADVCMPIITTEARLEIIDEMVNTDTEETAVPESSKLPLGVEIDYQGKEFQIVDGPEWKVSLVEPDKEVENDDGTPVIKLQRVQTSTVDATKKVIPLVEAEPEDNVVEKGAEEINKMENKKINLAVTKDTVEETPEVEEEANLEQQQNEPLAKNYKETTDTEKSMEIDPVVGKDQTFVVGGTTIQIEEKVTQVSLAEAEPDEEGENDDGTLVIQLQIDPVVSKEQAHVVGGTTIQIEEKFSLGESTETDQSDNERITRRSLRLSAKSVTATQKTRKSTRLHKVELDPVKETNMSRNEHEETSETTEETVNVCMPIITVESNMESLDERTNTNVEETTAVAPETSELLMGEEINYKEEASQIVEEVKPTETEPHEEAEKDDGTPVIMQKDTPLLVDLNKLSQNTEEQTDTPEVLTPDNSEYHLCNLTSEEDKQDMTVEGEKPTDGLVGQNDGKEREKVEEYKVVIDEDVEESVSTGEHPKATTMEDKTNTIQETENNQDIYLEDKQMDSDLEMISLGQEAPEAVQEILEEEASVSTERSLRRRTVKIQSPPIKKSRQVKRQEAEVFEDKTGTVQLTGKGDEEVHKEGVEIDKEETLQKTTVEATENIVSLIEGEPDENVIEQGFEEINNMENKETNLGNEVTPEMERDKVNLEQQENELSVENEKETAETEKPMEMDEVSVVNKEQTYGLEETTIQAEEEILQIESSETNENKNERSTRRSLRISSQSVTSTQKTRKSARLHKAELEPVKKEKMSINEETSSMTAKTLNVSVPVTIETNVENLDEVSKRVEATADEQDIDISNDKGRVDEALPEISTDVEEDETMTLIKITENKILVAMDKTQKDVEGEVQDVGESQEEQKQSESSTNERFALALEVEETSDQEKNKADEENRVVMEAPKEIFTSAEKYEKGEENISDDNEKGLVIGKHVVQSSSTIASTRRKSMRLQMHESKTKEDESNSESEVDQTAKQRHQRKRKAITDSTSARRLKRHVRARIV